MQLFSVVFQNNYFIFSSLQVFLVYCMQLLSIVFQSYWVIISSLLVYLVYCMQLLFFVFQSYRVINSSLQFYMVYYPFSCLVPLCIVFSFYLRTFGIISESLLVYLVYCIMSMFLSIQYSKSILYMLLNYHLVFYVLLTLLQSLLKYCQIAGNDSLPLL